MLRPDGGPGSQLMSDAPADSTAISSIPKSRSRSSSPYSWAWSRTSPTSTVWLGPGSRAIPSKADSKRSLSRPRRMTRFQGHPVEGGLEALAQPPPQDDPVSARSHGSAPVPLRLAGTDRPGTDRHCRDGTGGGALLGLGDGPGGVDQPDVAERLGEVADHLAAARVDFLGQQADVVDRRHGPLEGGGGRAELPGQRLSLCQPECAQQEGALLPGQAVVSEVAVYQAALVGQARGGRVDGRLHPRVIPGQEAGDGEHQVRGVKIVAAEGLGERAGLLAPAAGEDGGAD